MRMTALLHPTYFPNVAHMAIMLQSESINFEYCDTYGKQTYRNRCCIMGANGLLQLNIPVIHTQKNRQLYRNVAVTHAEKWQLKHLKSLETAYRKSPFFEYYIDDLKPLFTKEVSHLYEFNMDCLKVIFECLQLPLSFSFTKSFDQNQGQVSDARTLVFCKKEVNQFFENYIQVFNDKHGFVGNLSVLDLLFNEGPNTINYLKSQNVNLR